MTGAETRIRHLPQALEAWLRARVAIDPSPTETLINTATACIGVSESDKDNCGELVELFQATVGGVSREPWCMSFLQSCVAFVERVHDVKSALPATEHCLTLWRSLPLTLSAVKPVRGAIAVWRKAGTVNGHCGLIYRLGSKGFWTIEGNTSGGHGMERNGGGVFVKCRQSPHALGYKSRFIELGFLRPFAT